MKFFDEEIEELYWERMENKLDHSILEEIRNKYDPEWCTSRKIKKMNEIYDSNYGIIDRRLLLK